MTHGRKKLFPGFEEKVCVYKFGLDTIMLVTSFPTSHPSCATKAKMLAEALIVVVQKGWGQRNSSIPVRLQGTTSWMGAWDLIAVTTLCILSATLTLAD